MWLVLCELTEAQENELDSYHDYSWAPMRRLRGHDISWREMEKSGGRAFP